MAPGVFSRVLAVRRKRAVELDWWERQRAAEGSLHGAHYERLFTEPFELDRSVYTGASILDVGCGPRGSLEWAHDARERVGLDPLVRRYRGLGIDQHAMRYVGARAERIPFPDGHFDVVSAFNSLDHVENVERAAAELARVVRPGGLMLLIVDVGHAPTVTEPLTLDWDVTRLFAPALTPVFERRLARRHEGTHVNVLLDPSPYEEAPGVPAPGVLVAKLTRAQH